MNRCPSSQLLEQMLDERLPDAESRVISLHVSDCASCQATLERLTAETEVSGGSLSVILGREGSGNHSAVKEPLSPFLAKLQESSVLTLLTSVRSGDGPGSRPHPAGASVDENGVPVIPGYEILNELGRGGMGVVYKARQLGLNRLVALKMILAGPYARPKDLDRFRQEAEAVARLHHPNIVQIYDIGEADGIAYFALEFVEEGTLVQRLRGDLQPLEPTIRLVETLARTIHFAHQRGVVHRDLKPANILLASVGGLTSEAAGEEGAETVNHSPLTTHQPKITDFGLAKRLDEKSTGTMTGEVVGTPSYMAPEQAAGKTQLVGAPADVYALGAILYEMLTGRPPFKGATAVDTVVQVLHEEPVRPSRLRPSLPRDLETICLKCLAKEPTRRYSSAEALADDLQRYRKGKPILARPVSVPERAWKWAWRRPLPASLLAGMILSIVLGFAGVTWQLQETMLARDTALEEQFNAEVQRTKAEKARDEASEERSKAQLALYYSRIAQSQLQWRVNNVPGAVQSLTRCLPLPGHEDQRGWEWRYLFGLFHSDLFTFTHPLAPVGGNAVYHPQGRMIASVVGGHPTDDDAHPGEVRFWDATTGTLLQTLHAPGTVHRLVFRPDGEQFALATTDGQVLVWQTTTGKELLRTSLHRQMVSNLAFSPDGQLLASASWDQTVKVCNATTGQVVHVLQGHTARVQSVAFHPDGKRLVSGDWDATVKIWNTLTGREILSLSGHKSPVSGTSFSPDGGLLASSSSNGNVKIWELATGRVTQSLTSRSGTVLGNCFSPDGRYLAYCSGDGTVRVWDVESGIERVNFRGHTAPVESVQFSPDGQRLVSSSPLEAAVKVWDFTRHPEYGTFARVRGRPNEQIKVRDLTGRADSMVLARTGPDLEALAFHADGKHLVSVAMGGKLQSWDVTTGVLKEQRALAMCDELVSPAVQAAFSPGGIRLAARAREDKSLVKAWDVAGGTEVLAFRGHTMPVLCVRFSADGRRLVTCGCDLTRVDRAHEIKVWDAATGECLATRTGQGLLFNAVFSPDCRWLALGGQDGVVWLGDWAAAGKFVRLPGHKSHVAAVAFRGDGRLLATAGVEDKTLKIWELDGFDPERDAIPKTVHTLAAPAVLCDLAFSPDGRRLAGISRDAVKLWDVATHLEVLSLRGAPQRYWDPAFNPRVVFSPDGKRLVGTNWDESISMWDAGISGDDNGVARHQDARRQTADARAVFWHLEEAEDCWNHHNQAAARFHLQRLGNTPLPEPLQLRRDQLAVELKE